MALLTSPGFEFFAMPCACSFLSRSNSFGLADFSSPSTLARAVLAEALVVADSGPGLVAKTLSDGKACSTDDWRDRDGSVVVLRLNEGRWARLPPDEPDTMLSVDDDALIWTVDREGQAEDCGALGVSA